MLPHTITVLMLHLHRKDGLGSNGQFYPPLPPFNLQTYFQSFYWNICISFHQKYKMFFLEPRSLRINWELSFCQWGKILSRFDIDLHPPVLSLCQMTVLAYVSLAVIVTISWDSWCPKTHTHANPGVCFDLHSATALWMQSRRHINVIHRNKSAWPLTLACGDQWRYLWIAVPRTDQKQWRKIKGQTGL